MHSIMSFIRKHTPLRAAISTSVFAVLILVTVAPARSGGQSSEPISAERIATHIRFLASDKLQGRRAGTPAADEAAAYISAEFKKYGLKPPPTTQSYLQPFTFVSGVKLGPANRLVLKTSSGTSSLAVEKDFMPLAFSSGTQVSGEAVFVGYGISAPEQSYDNYAGLDVKGKVVLLMRGSPDGDNPHGRFADFTQPGLEIQNKTLKAREKGAIAVIFLSAENDFHRDSLSRLRFDLNFLDAGIPAAAVSKDIADSLLSRSNLKVTDTDRHVHDGSVRLNDVSIELKTDVVKVEGKGANVVGFLRGSDSRLAKEYVVIGAHYDHLGLGGPESLAANPEGQIHHGADDNASGTAALMELARVMSSMKTKPKRSIVFAAFCGEELGLLGSAAYTKSPPVPLASTVAMLNMDMVGRLRNDSLFVGGVGTSPEWKSALEELNDSPGFGNGNGHGGTVSGKAFQFSFGQDGYGPSDHQSFYVRDIPVLFFFTGSHDDYHKPTDTADKINFEGAVRVATLVESIADRIADEPTRIAFTKVKSEQRPAGRGFRVYLGTVPNYSDQSDGMKLDGVRPGSPAERAGLQAGDLVVKLGNTPIKNVYDYTYALGEMSPGQEVEIVIKRAGSVMTLKITPDKRQ